MRKIFSLVFVFLVSFLTVGCSSSLNKETEALPAQTLYSKGQEYLLKEDYDSAIRYLNAAERKVGVQSDVGEQTQLSLIYANYKTGEYEKALEMSEQFARVYANSNKMDYVHYLAALSNVRLTDNFLQDLFGVNPVSRGADKIRNAYGNFQIILQKYPQSRYAKDAEKWSRYLINRLAENELEIVKFYAKRGSHIAVANRVQVMLTKYPNTKATIDGLVYLQDAFHKMGLTHSEQETAKLIAQYKDLPKVKIPKPAYHKQF